MARVEDLHVGPPARAIVIPASEFQWQFARSGGPGGQHVNRTSSKAALRFDVRGCRHLPDDVRQRLVTRERSRLTLDGALVITSQRHRDQGRNVAECVTKLRAILARALVPPTPRRRTKPPRAAATTRLETKRRRGLTKRLRGRPGGEG